MKVGDEFQTLADIDRIFAEHTDVSRIQAERRAKGQYVITVMDDHRPNDLKWVSTVANLDYERHNKRGFEQVSGYHVPTDTVKYVFYRLRAG